MTMKATSSFRTVLMVLVIALATSGCPTSYHGPIPPSTPQPLSAFSVKFAPAGATQYPATDVQEVQRFKNVLHWPGEPDLVRGDEKPTRPYVKIGELTFEENWYYSSNISELINTHVPAVGGDAVLVYHAYQTATAEMEQESTGAMENVYYQSIVLEVIRYTDR